MAGTSPVCPCCFPRRRTLAQSMSIIPWSLLSEKGARVGRVGILIGLFFCIQTLCFLVMWKRNTRVYQQSIWCAVFRNTSSYTRRETPCGQERRRTALPMDKNIFCHRCFSQLVAAVRWRRHTSWYFYGGAYVLIHRFWVCGIKNTNVLDLRERLSPASFSVFYIAVATLFMDTSCLLSCYV